MIRTTLWAAVGLAAVTLIVWNGAAAKGPQEDQKPGAAASAEKMSPFKECAKACDDCARSCDECGAHCARMLAEGKKDHIESLRQVQDCATVCSAASCILSRGGPDADLICVACADACKRCGDACEKHAAHDPIMKANTEECRRCEKACRTMLQNSGFDANAKPGKR